jgi:hypothetical protein
VSGSQPPHLSQNELFRRSRKIDIVDIIPGELKSGDNDSKPSGQAVGPILHLVSYRSRSRSVAQSLFLARFQCAPMAVIDVAITAKTRHGPDDPKSPLQKSI